MATYRSIIPTCIMACLISIGSTAYAQESDVVRIAVSNDLSGVYSDLGGIGSVAAARLAVEDFGGNILGKRIEIISGDNQNKADIASQMARTWFDTQGVVAILSGGASSAGLATQRVATEKDRAVLITAGFASEFSGKQCSPVSTHWSPETYTLSSGVTQNLIARGGKSWYFVTPNYVFGKTLEASAAKFVKQLDGKISGQLLYPFPTADFSSFILQAQSSGAEVIGFSGAGHDLVTFVKQAADFGVTQKIAPFLVFSTDVRSMGLELAQGLSFVTPFYWDANEKTVEWTKRWQAATGFSHAPTMVHALDYESTLSYLRAVEAAGTFEGAKVNEKMRELKPANILIQNAHIRPEDGMVVMDMYEVEVKSPSESKSPNDIYKILATIPGEKVHLPLSESECPMVAG